MQGKSILVRVFKRVARVSSYRRLELPGGKIKEIENCRLVLTQPDANTRVSLEEFWKYLYKSSPAFLVYINLRNLPNLLFCVSTRSIY